MSLSKIQEQIIKRLYYDPYGKIAHFTHKNLADVLAVQGNREYEVPTFDPDKIQNLPDNENNHLESWDSWVVLNHKGRPANFNGYYLQVAMAGAWDDASQGYLYLYSQPINSNSFEDWHLIGRLFNAAMHKDSQDYYIQKQTQEWSGSTILEDDGSLRLFYAAYSGAKSAGGSGDSDQTLVTANIKLSFDEATGKISIGNVSDWRSLFDGDSENYESESQFDVIKWAQENNHAMRDAHYFEDNEHKYIVFESNTGLNFGYQGEVEDYNIANLGGDISFNIDKVEELNNHTDEMSLSRVANGCLGLIELTDDYKIKQVLPPLLVATTVTDEIERPNIIYHKGLYYLFTVTRGAKMANNQVSGRDIYMLGYYSPSLSVPFQPMNGCGIVLHQDAKSSAVDFTYSYLLIPHIESNDSDEFVVTSYATNRNRDDGHHATFAPSFTLKLNKGISSVTGNILQQGQIKL